LTAVLPTRAADPKFTPEQLAFFEKEVRPLLKQHCFKCHGEKDRGGLRLNSREAVLKGGDLGPAVDLAKPEASTLLKAVHWKDGLEMPPSGKLPAKDLETLTNWVKSGLPYPAGDATVVAPPRHEEGGKVTPESRNYWAYRPVVRPEVPAVKDAKWVRNPVDAFLLAKLEAKGVAPAGPAGKVALVRRVYFDLIGLPPTPEEADAFVKDDSPDAYEKLVDRLLASPQYGEKWGRHWLDLVRFAESHGYERDSTKPFAWRYRDYVIDSFNKDKPYDRFVTEQLAGDELDEVTPETLTATGYYRLGIWDDEPADRALARYDVLDGVVSTTASVMLGMSMGCARCHDHKRDPIPQKDYYRLLAVFDNVSDMNVANLRRVATPADRAERERRLREKAARETELFTKVYGLEQRFAAAFADKLGLKTGGGDLTGLSYRFYRDTWDKLPDFAAYKPEAEGTVAQGFFSLAPASRPQAIGLVFEGKLRVPADGEYSFFSESSDGLRLTVDGKVVLDRPGKGRQKGEGKAKLAAGLVPVRLEYFNGDGAPALSVAWAGPGFERRPLSADQSVLVPDARSGERSWQYTTKRPADDWATPAFKPEGWQTGTGGFGTPGTPGAVVRTEWKSKGIWLRQTFTLAAVPPTVSLDLHHDEDAEIYLNGVRVHEAKGFRRDYTRVVLGPEATRALKVGENILAVHCLQTGGGQYIDAGLVAGGTADLPGLIRGRGAEALGEEAVREYEAAAAELDRVRKTPVAEPGQDVMCVEERGRRATHVLVRGNPGANGERVEPGVPEVLTRELVNFKDRPAEAPTTGRRRALAEWLTRPDNPLTARVMVNRVWQYHFGRGIVPSSNDFGKLGESPTHPELLDWLASEFVRGGWSVKALHRLIMTSSAYRMSAQATDAGLKADPGNLLFWRFNPRRLQAEEVRDSILAVSGRLNPAAGGPSVYPEIPKEVLAGQSRPGDGWGKSPPEEASRRSVYVFVKRSLQVPILSVHDQADTDSSCAVRYTTTVPTQALGMLNGEFTNEQARFLAARLAKEAPGDVSGQVARAVRLTTGRMPTADEVRKDAEFVRSLVKAGRSEGEALRLYCLLALNTNEFVYID
jgi:hypothetical protein